jgi:hypothetical protein
MPTAIEYNILDLNTVAGTLRNPGIDTIGPTDGMDTRLKGNPLKTEKTRTIATMGFHKDLLALVPPTVQALSVQDLHDMATRFSGSPVQNAKINALSIQEIQSIEVLFRDARNQALAAAATVMVAGSQAQLNDVNIDVSCCCCTPCCSCAATDVHPFEN